MNNTSVRGVSLPPVSEREIREIEKRLEKNGRCLSDLNWSDEKIKTYIAIHKERQPAAWMDTIILRLHEAIHARKTIADPGHFNLDGLGIRITITNQVIPGIWTLDVTWTLRRILSAVADGETAIRFGRHGLEYIEFIRLLDSVSGAF